MKVRDMYEAYCYGDQLTDNDITVGVAHFEALTDLLTLSGPAFAIQAKEANRVAQWMRSVHQARGLVNKKAC